MLAGDGTMQIARLLVPLRRPPAGRMNSRLGKRNVRLRGPLVPHASLCTPSAPFG
jgi:hypothetical protein